MRRKRNPDEQSSETLRSVYDNPIIMICTNEVQYRRAGVKTGGGSEAEVPPVVWHPSRYLDGRRGVCKCNLQRQPNRISFMTLFDPLS
ncbi:hypothetical protein K440DRAFT_130340 [Wilcoxina mikolae CBS 423.85]|nr:hypothetical protein K440DRAFT_130340 [Wilcoxina mikolae CBS 423.85]